MLTLPPQIPAMLTREIQFSVNCIRTACGLAAGWEARGPVGIQQKPDGTKVTEIDYAVQAYVARELENNFPSDALVAEEESGQLKKDSRLHDLALSCLSTLIPGADSFQMMKWLARGESMPAKRHWLLDPVDSTNGLIAGGLYCINLALVENGQVMVGVIGIPKPFAPWFSETAVASGTIYVAVRGGGSWWAALDESPIFSSLKVSERTDVLQAIRIRSLSRSDPQQTKADARRRENVSRSFGEEGAHIRAPAPIRYPLLAAGQADLYIHLDLSGRKRGRKFVKGMKAWDHAAGSLLVEEAGGRVTDLAGRPLDFETGRILSNNRGILASNGFLHRDALALLKRLGEGRVRPSK